MTARILLIFFIILLSCSKEEAKYEPKPRSDPYKLYEDAYQAFENGDYFYAQKKFSEILQLGLLIFARGKTN